MFLTTTILRNQGLRIDAGIVDAVLNRCIVDTQVLCEAMLGADATAILKGEQATSVLLVGGDTTEGKYLLGLQRSASYIAYALLLRDNVFASVYGTTNKRDDLSNQVDPVDAARQWYANGERGLSALIEQLITEDRLPKTYRIRPQSVPFINELAF